MKLSISEKRTFLGAAAIMLAALLWSLDGVFIRPKFYEFPASLIVFLEHFLGFIVLSPFIILNWSKIKRLNKKDWIAIFWVALFGGVLGTIMITKAFFAAIFGEVTFATVIILQKLQPVFALILARIILKEKLSKRFYVWAAVAILAAYVLAFGKTGLDLSGVNFWHSAALFSFLAAFAFGSSTVFGKRIVNHIDFASAAALRFGVTSALAFLLILANKNIFALSSLGGVYWLYLVLIVFTTGAGAIFIYYFGLKRVTASTATICELFWPISAVILDYFINKNVLNTVEIVASLVLLLAFWQVIKENKSRKFSFESRVVSGEGRGANMGYPTINLEKTDIDLNHGIYLVEAEINKKKYEGLLHFGPKKTFSPDLSTELYIVERLSDIEKVNIKIKKRIRDIIKFSSREELKKQIAEDLKFLNKNV